MDCVKERDCGGQEDGFLLIELVLATVVLIVALCTTVSLSLQHTRLRGLGHEMERASVACRNNLEDLRSLPFADLPTLHDQRFDVPAVNGSPGGLRPVPGHDLPGKFRVTVDQTAGGETLYLVAAEVTWIGIGGRRTVEFTRLFTNRQN